MPVTTADRALGALYGLAVGDALGMPTETLTGPEVRARFGAVTGFRAGEGERSALPAGRVTDDTEHALIVARLLLDGDGVVSPQRLVAELLRWQRDAAVAGTGMLLGPSTERALAAARAGESLDVTGRRGTTNGAAMRITPVGIATPPEPLGRLVDAVVAVDRPTHHTGAAHAGAAAVAAAVSSGVADAGWAESVTLATSAAREAGGRGFPPYGDGVLQRLRNLPDTLDAIAAGGLGFASEESVPAAFALAAFSPDDPWRVCLHAAALGGDSDTIGAIAGALSGAHAGATALPLAARETVRRVNGLNLESVVSGLLHLRSARA